MLDYSLASEFAHPKSIRTRHITCANCSAAQLGTFLPDTAQPPSKRSTEFPLNPEPRDSHSWASRRRPRSIAVLGGSAHLRPATPRCHRCPDTRLAAQSSQRTEVVSTSRYCSVPFWVQTLDTAPPHDSERPLEPHPSLRRRQQQDRRCMRPASSSQSRANGQMWLTCLDADTSH